MLRSRSQALPGSALPSRLRLDPRPTHTSTTRLSFLRCWQPAPPDPRAPDSMVNVRWNRLKASGNIPFGTLGKSAFAESENTSAKSHLYCPKVSPVFNQEHAVTVEVPHDRRLSPVGD